MDGDRENRMYLDSAIDDIEIAQYQIEKAVEALWSTESIKAKEWGPLNRHIKAGLQYIYLAEACLNKLKEEL